MGGGWEACRVLWEIQTVHQLQVAVSLDGTHQDYTTQSRVHEPNQELKNASRKLWGVQVPNLVLYGCLVFQQRSDWPADLSWLSIGCAEASSSQEEPAREIQHQKEERDEEKRHLHDDVFGGRGL